MAGGLIPSSLPLDKNVKKHKKKAIISLSDLIISLLIILFFLVLWYISPLGVYPDSGSYISMQNGREPIYPLFLLLFRTIFHEKDTLVWLAASGALDTEKAQELLKTWPALHTTTLVQSLLAALGCIMLARTAMAIMKTKKDVGPRDQEGLFIKLCIYAASLIPYVLTPLASSSRMVLGRAVLTEGLAFPLFYIFLSLLLSGLFIWRDRIFLLRFLPALLMLLLLTLTRNQMLIYLPVTLLLMVLSAWDQLPFDGIRIRILVLTISVIAISGVFVLTRSVTVNFYTSNINEGYKGASTGPYNMLTTLIYLSNESTADRIENPTDRALFIQMYQEARDRGLLLTEAPGGLLQRAYHYEDAYDTIGFEIQQPCLFGYMEQRGVADGDALNEVITSCSRIRRDIFPGLAPLYLANYLRTAVSGLTRSVAASGNIMAIYALIMYLLAMAMIYMLAGSLKSRDHNAALLMALALLMIGANSFGTALMIMCLSRYMIYNTSLFYIAFIYCLCGMWGRLHRKGR